MNSEKSEDQMKKLAKEALVLNKVKPQATGSTAVSANKKIKPTR